MKVDPNLLTYVEQLKENPLEGIEDFPEIPSITVSHFDTAIELSEKFVHKKNRFLTDDLMQNRDRLLEGYSLAPFCKTVKELKKFLVRELPKFWNRDKHEEIIWSVNSAFPIESYRPFFKLQKLVDVLRRPSGIKNYLNNSLEEVNQIDLNELKELIEECKQIQDSVLLKEEN